MQINQLIRTLVGADLSRPSLIYRPRWIFRYPDYLVNVHYRVPRPAAGLQHRANAHTSETLDMRQL